MIPTPKLIGAIGLVLAFAGWTGAAYWKGGAAPRAELAARDAADARDRARQLRNKERNDAEYARRDADLRRTIARLQQRPLDVAGERPAGSKCPEGQLCYDATEFERAYGVFARGARAVAAEGTSLGLELELAEEWANGD